MFCKKKCGFLKKCDSNTGMCIINKTLFIILSIIIFYLIIISIYFYNLTKKGKTESYKNTNWNDIISGY